MNFEFTKEWLVVSNFLTMTSKVEIKASKFSENWLPIYIFFHNRLKPSNFFQNQLPTSNFFRNRLPTSNFFQIRLPTSNFLQNRVPTSNFLPNRLPTSNFSTIIEGGTVPPSIAYFCSPAWSVPDLGCASYRGKLSNCAKSFRELNPDFFSVALFHARGKLPFIICHGHFLGVHGHFFQICHVQFYPILHWHGHFE